MNQKIIFNVSTHSEQHLVNENLALREVVEKYRRELIKNKNAVNDVASLLWEGLQKSKTSKKWDDNSFLCLNSISFYFYNTYLSWELKILTAAKIHVMILKSCQLWSDTKMSWCSSRNNQAAHSCPLWFSLNKPPNNSAIVKFDQYVREQYIWILRANDFKDNYLPPLKSLHGQMEQTKRALAFIILIKFKRH